MYALPRQIREFIDSRYRWYQKPKVLRIFRGLERGEVVNEDSLDSLLRELNFYLVFNKDEFNKEDIEYISNLLHSLERNGYESEYYLMLRNKLSKLVTTNQ